MQLRRQIIKIVTAISLVFVGVNSSYAAEISHQQAKEIKAEIKQLVDDYGYYRDSYQAEGYANVFSEDGKFIFRGQVYQGHEALAKRIHDADKTGVSLHMMSSSHVDILDANNATGIHYAAIYSKTPEEPLQKGAMISVNGPAVIGKYTDKYVLTENGWKISERMFIPVFNTAE